VIALGARLGELPSHGYTLFTPERTVETLVHIHPDPEDLGRVWPPALASASDLASAALALSRIPLPAGRWAENLAAAKAELAAFTQPVPVTGKINLSEVFRQLESLVPEDAIICNGAGNHTAWLHRFYRHRRFGTQLAPTNGAMGFGFPAAIAAKLVHPDRQVVDVAGDGCFLMTGQELATAVQYGAAFVTIVVDNGSYGTIRMHQERDYPGRTIGTDLRNPDFAAYARAFGGWGALVETTEEFAPAFKAAQASGLPAILHLKTDIEDISPGKSLHPAKA
jgi:acetolactate synthase-1/2/3 large subunit